MSGLGKELKDMAAADIPDMWASIDRTRAHAMRSPNMHTQVAAGYAVRAVERQIGALMAQDLPEQGPRPEYDMPEVALAAGIPAVSAALAEAATVQLPDSLGVAATA